MKKFYSFALLPLLGIILITSGCASSKQYTVDEKAVEEGPVGTIALDFKEIAIGIGFQKGDGILTYNGIAYPFKMKGMDYGSLSKVTFNTTGEIYHMKDISEFEGMYFLAKAGLTIGKAGKAGIFLVNKKGVTIHLGSQKESGFDLALGRGGIKIKLIKSDEPTAATAESIPAAESTPIATEPAPEPAAVTIHP